MEKEMLKKLIDTALGRRKADLVIKNCRVVNVFSGTVTEGDFLWALSACGGSVKMLEKEPLSGIIRSKRDKAVTVSADMEELLLLIMEQNFVPVTDDRGKFIGIVTRRDIIKYFYEKQCKESESAV